MKKLLLAVLLMSMSAIAGDVTIWVPPYYIDECKKTVDMDFGGIKIEWSWRVVGCKESGGGYAVHFVLVGND